MWPPQPQQSWMNLETSAWKARGNGRKAKNIPKAIRRSWASLTAAQKTAIGTFLTAERVARDNMLALNAARPAPPDVDALRPERVDFLNAIRLLRTSIRRAILSIDDLRRERMLYDDSYDVDAYLATQRAVLLPQDTTYTAMINNLWHALLGPTGTPPPSPGADEAGPNAMPMAPAPTASWVGGFALGGGGQSVPGIYLRQNRNGRIIDRVCVKDTHWPEESDLALWDPDFRPIGSDTNHELRNPSEIGSLLNLNSQGRSESIIQLRNWHRVARANAIVSYRTYQEWCSYGDLFALSRKYTPYRDILGIPRPATLAEQDWVPEAFLWCCLENLANAGGLMQTGGPNLLGPATWSEIIHADLKPQNVFLADNNTSGIYAGYPQLKVGDFGLANMISHDRTRVLPPNEYHGGTERCKAPEQVDATQRVSEKTNIWGIGVIMWGLMHSRGNATAFYTYVDADDPDDSQYIPTDPRPPTVNFSPDHQRVYSNEIRQVVLDCLNVVPAARPTYAVIHDETRRHTTPGGTNPDRADGLRDAGKDDEKFHDDGHDLKLSAEYMPLYAALALHMPGLTTAPAPDTTAIAPSSGTAGLLGPAAGLTIPG